MKRFSKACELLELNVYGSINAETFLTERLYLKKAKEY